MVKGRRAQQKLSSGREMPRCWIQRTNTFKRSLEAYPRIKGKDALREQTEKISPEKKKL